MLRKDVFILGQILCTEGSRSSWGARHPEGPSGPPGMPRGF